MGAIERVTAYLVAIDRVNAGSVHHCNFDDEVHGINGIMLRRSDLRTLLAQVTPVDKEELI